MRFIKKIYMKKFLLLISVVFMGACNTDLQYRLTYDNQSSQKKTVYVFVDYNEQAMAPYYYQCGDNTPGKYQHDLPANTSGEFTVEIRNCGKGSYRFNWFSDYKQSEYRRMYWSDSNNNIVQLPPLVINSNGMTQPDTLVFSSKPAVVKTTGLCPVNVERSITYRTPGCWADLGIFSFCYCTSGCHSLYTWVETIFKEAPLNGACP